MPRLFKKFVNWIFFLFYIIVMTTVKQVRGTKYEGLLSHESCVIAGDVTIGQGTIIHPKAQIIAEAGPIIIGERNLIEDGAIIINKATNMETGSVPVMIIGNLNVFEVYSQCEARKVGDNNVFESKCYVGSDVVVSNNCVVSAACRLKTEEILPENSVVYGEDCNRRISYGHQPQLLQLDHLSKLLPNYQDFMKKAKKTRDPHVK